MALCHLGFPEFTRFFNPDFSGKLRFGVNLAMAVGAQQNAFIQLFLDLGPAPRIPFFRYTEILAGGVLMVKLKGFNALVVSAYFAASAFVFHGRLPDFFPAFMNGSDQILSAVCVTAGFSFRHVFTCVPLRDPLLAPALPGLAQPPALPTELSGNNFLKTSP